MSARDIEIVFNQNKVRLHPKDGWIEATITEIDSWDGDKSIEFNLEPDMARKLSRALWGMAYDLETKRMANRLDV